MLNNILKVGVGLVCIYFMRLDGSSVDVNANANEPIALVFNQDDVKGKFELLFENLKNQKIISSSSQLLSVTIVDNEVVLNVNESFIYIGGTYKEQEVVNKFIQLGLSQPKIKYVTILVDGEISETSEGINLYKLSKLFELD